MKPIEKYQQKFIELLKEAEEELGGNLAVKVASTEEGLESDTCLGYVKAREYRCSIATVNDFLL
jgi:hypothetical protein